MSDINIDEELANVSLFIDEEPCKLDSDRTYIVLKVELASHVFTLQMPAHQYSILKDMMPPQHLFNEIIAKTMKNLS